MQIELINKSVAPISLNYIGEYTFHNDYKFIELEPKSSKTIYVKTKKVKNYKEYYNILKSNNIVLDHNEREKIILKKFSAISKSKNSFFVLPIFTGSIILLATRDN